MFDNHVWPQITKRLDFEPGWDEIHKMYKVQADRKEIEKRRGRKWWGKTDAETREREKRKPYEDLADTIIFDTVDRLKNLNYFISWKDGTPVQYNRPRFLATPQEDGFYHPTSDRIQGSNALLAYNLEASSARLKDLPLKQHLYLYGLAFIYSAFRYELAPDGTILEAYTDMVPMSIRKVWLNYQLSMDEFDNQPCPFFFNLQPRGMVLRNQYDPLRNPFGYVNLEYLKQAEYPITQELSAWMKAQNQGDHTTQQSVSILNQKPEFGNEALWTFFPLLPVDEQGMFDENGTYERFIVEVFSNNLIKGTIVPIRVQRLPYPNGRLPLYGACNIPDLDSGLYTPSIGSLLKNHYHEIVTSKYQFIKNKEWINNPSTWHLLGSPSLAQECNEPGEHIEVNSKDEMGWRPVYDGTQTTLQFIQYTREQAQTSGKAVDAILGKAMGGRTTATEASNAFQAGMSGVTSDVDYANNRLYGGYALRVWDNASYYLDDDLLKRITGSRGLHQLSTQDLAVRVGIKTDVGSTFIESIVKQQHLQNAIMGATNSPHLDQGKLWKALFRELKLNEAIDAVIDGGVESEIATATEQAVKTYYGEKLIINPQQNHEIAIKVKTKFLEDIDSHWNSTYAGLPSAMNPAMTRAQDLAMQIQLHQQFLLVLMQQQQLQQQALQETQNRLEITKQQALKDND